VPVRQVVPEVQTYQVVGETTVQETRQVWHRSGEGAGAGAGAGAGGWR
jgi:hypothetical protein